MNEPINKYNLKKKKPIKFQFTFPFKQIGRSYKSSPTSPTGQTPTD
jgi:hypothetical protein